ncbi:baseplate assembly protein [Pseudoalteromonas sp. S16_S37]|uniref:baseplate assembly protein n=1 Tax=Pseudoalteromonas sp. S16_S37 TaxID=2720228 RepID=UPI001680E898|nr:baseplate J/gp47 family protein [Pseudoalteromonas sp. S16_S37]MBD1582496.1 baseplate protein [Pseudoalteromonas sp. S16_S37]
MSLTNFSAIDFKQLPTPELIEPLSFEVIKAAILDDFKTRYPTFELDMPSDPIIKLIESFAYRELLLRQRVNEAAEKVLLAKASAPELDYLGARFGVTREQNEDNERYRARIQLALEGFSTAGPAGAYVFHTLKASEHVKDVHVDAPEFEHQALPAELKKHLPNSVFLLNTTKSAGLEKPQPGDVVITILSDEGNGTASTQVINEVKAHLNDDDIRPLTDIVNVKSANIAEFNIEAVLTLYFGPEEEAVRSQVEQACSDWLKTQYKLGHDISLSSLYAVLHGAGVQRVELISPTSDIVVGANEAPFCKSLKVTVGGRHV